jgi:FAD/FMN-containing dehydrogenase
LLLIAAPRSIILGRMATVIDGLAGFKGTLLRPDVKGYEAARAIWNGAIRRRPALIARCTSDDDVAAAFAYARRSELPISVRGGGHNVAGTALCEGGVLIDLQPMKRVVVDASARRVVAEPGVLLGELDSATQAYGLAVPSGINSTTGIAGLTLGGGIGWLMRAYGLTCDNLLSARVMLADGSSVVASQSENQDLFWAIRGGGGNFGIVTRFEFDAHPLGPEVLAGAVLHPAENARDVLRFYRDFAASAPAELTTVVNLRSAPPASWIPESMHGRDVVIIAACWAGEQAAGQKALSALKEYGAPLVDAIVPKPFTDHQTFFNPTVPHGWGYYWKSTYTTDWTDRAIDTLVDNAWRKRSDKSYTIVFQMGGRVARGDEQGMAFTGRDAAFAVNINAAWADPSGPSVDVEWARGFWRALEPFSTGGVYVNFLSEEGEERVRTAYGAKWERLRDLKRRYDPDNVFRVNQNISPAG